MAGRRRSVDVELTLISARDLKNVNWRYGALRAYAVAWVDPNFKASAQIDREGDTNPCWNEKISIPISMPIENAELQIDIVHEKPSELTKPLIGTARIYLNEVLDEVGFDEKLQRSLKLKRPSGRPQGKLEVAIRLREHRPQYPPSGAYAQPYGTRDYVPPQQGYAPSYPSYPPQQYPYGNPAPYPTSGPSYGAAYSQPGSYEAYGGNSYSNQSGYGYGASAPAAATAPPVYEKPKSSKYGLGTGLAVGAVAGVLGGLAIAEGADYIEDKIADDVTDRVEENEANDDYDDDY